MGNRVEEMRVGTGNAPGSVATRFQPGHSGRKNSGTNKDAVQKPSSRKPSLLHVMRLVFERNETKDRTPGQKALRRVLNENPKYFLGQLVKLEQLFQEEVRMGIGTPAGADDMEALVAVDEGGERARSLLDTLLERSRQDKKSSL
jgi:hypothetical protein